MELGAGDKTLVPPIREDGGVRGQEQACRQAGTEFGALPRTDKFANGIEPESSWYNEARLARRQAAHAPIFTLPQSSTLAVIVRVAVGCIAAKSAWDHMLRQTLCAAEAQKAHRKDRKRKA